MPEARIATRTTSALFLGAAMVIGGCGSGLDAARGEGREIGIEDFAGPLAEPTPETAPPDPARQSAEAAADDAEDQPAQQAASEAGATPGLQAVPGPPPRLSAGTPPEPTEPPELVEAKVGDINGRPVFASEFLEPLSGKFEAEARRMSPRAWRAMANQDIVERLNDIVLDELLRAEALERLTPQQRVGFRGFLESLRRDLLSANYGSREVAERRLQEQSGLTEAEWLARQREESLIQVAIQEQIESRVTVSFRDIKQRYERDIEIYQPDPTARFRLIRAQGDEAAEVERQLAEGEPFHEIAGSELNSFEPETEGVRRVQFDPPREEADFFGGALNDAARTVEVGEVRGPVEVGSSQYWITLEEIEQDGKSLYEAQLEIERRIRSERTQEELQRFLQTRVERANVSSLDDMRRRLLRIATDRFGPRANGDG